MSTSESMAAVVTGIRRIEMRRFSVPEPGTADGIVKVEPCGICVSYRYRTPTAP